jgi:hypothetical protein
MPGACFKETATGQQTQSSSLRQQCEMSRKLKAVAKRKRQNEGKNRYHNYRVGTLDSLRYTKDGSSSGKHF